MFNILAVKNKRKFIISLLVLGIVYLLVIFIYFFPEAHGKIIAQFWKLFTGDQIQYNGVILKTPANWIILKGRMYRLPPGHAVFLESAGGFPREIRLDFITKGIPKEEIMKELEDVNRKVGIITDVKDVQKIYIKDTAAYLIVKTLFVDESANLQVESIWIPSKNVELSYFRKESKLSYLNEILENLFIQE